MAQVLRYAACTDHGAGGDPAGVVLDAERLGDREMLQTADFCGHATLVPAVALADAGATAPVPLTRRTAVDAAAIGGGRR